MLEESVRERMKELYIKNSRIPKRYLTDISLYPYTQNDMESFKYLKKVEELSPFFIGKYHYNLCIFSSNVGNGKTTWATKIALAYIDKYASSVSWENDCPVLFINLADYLYLTKSAFTNKEAKEEIDDINKKIHTASLVIFDDIATKEISSDFDRDLLYNHINHRVSNNMSCIFTSNVTGDGLSKVLGSRLSHRILDFSKKIITIESGAIKVEGE